MKTVHALSPADAALLGGLGLLLLATGILASLAIPC